MARIGVVVASGFEQAEMTALCKALVEAGHRMAVVSTKKHEVRSWDNTHWAGDIPVDVAAMDARAEDFAALVLPGGILGADTLRSDEFIIRLMRDAAALGKPVAAMGHANWVVIEAGLASGRAMTCHPAIRTDVINAGAMWRDEAAVSDSSVISGRNSHDVGAFAAAFLAAAT
jgi:protease I